MPLGTRNQNTMSEALRGILQDLAYVQTLPDADLDFLSTIHQTILSKLREPMDAYLQSQSAAGTGAPPAPQSPTGAPALGGAGGFSDPMGGGAPPSPGGDMGGIGALIQQMTGGAGAAPTPPAGVRPDINMAPATDELRRMLTSRAGA